MTDLKQKSSSMSLKTLKAMRKERKCAAYTSPLPPCKICGAKASGLHYGVNTCEACKGFFRRAIKFQRRYRCFQQQNCDVTGGRSIRTSCPFCRLQKCLNMGMAHNAIKTGRYTHAKRTENIMEVKRLENAAKSSPFEDYSVHFDEKSPLKSQIDMNTNLNMPPFPSTPQNFSGGCGMEQCWSSEIHIKEEIPNEMDFHHPLDHPDEQIEQLQLESIKMNILGDSFIIYDRISSQEFISGLNDIVVSGVHERLVSAKMHQNNKLKCEILIDKDNPTYEGSMSVSRLQQNTPCQYDPFPPFSSEKKQNELQEDEEEEGIYISIPTPPSSTDCSRDDCCLDFSSDFFPEKPPVVVITPPPSTQAYTEKTFSFCANNIKTSSNLLTSSHSQVLPPLLVTPSKLSVLSPASLCSYSPSVSPSSSLNMSLDDSTGPFHLGYGQPTQNGNENIFQDLSKIFHQNTSKVIEIILSNHRKNVLTLIEHDRYFIKERHEKYNEKIKMKEEVFGLQSCYLTDDDYLEIFSQTGLDIDGRCELIMGAGTFLCRYLQALMQFATSVPGFTRLNPSDQFTLLYSAKRSLWFLNAYLGFDSQESLILMPNLQVYTKMEASVLLGSKFIDKCFSIVHYFKKKNIPYEVFVLWKIVLLLSTDDIDLIEPERASELQSIYVNCLLKLTNKMKGEKPGIFAHLINLTMLLKELDHLAMKLILWSEHDLYEELRRYYVKAYL